MISKKAQNITNPYTIIFLVIVISLFSVSFLNFGRDLASDPSNSLGEQSIDFIYNTTAYQPTVNKTSSDTGEEFYKSPTENAGNLKDFALEFQFYREQSNQLRQILQDIWNIPTNFVRNLGLNLVLWEPIILIINLLIWSILFFAMYKFLRGLIR